MNIPDCFTLIDQAQQELFGPRRADWLNRLEQAYGDLLAALHQLHEQGEVEQGLRLATGLRELWLNNNHISEGRNWLSRFLQLPLMSVPKAVQAKALDVAGVLAFWQDDRATAQALMEQGLALRRDLNDKSGIAVSLLHIGFNKWIFEYDYLTAQALHEQSLALYQQLNSPVGVAYALLNLGHVALAQHDYTVADSHLKPSIATLQKHNEWWAINFALSDFACLAAQQGQPDRALCIMSANEALRDTFHIMVPSVWQKWVEEMFEPARRVQGDYLTAIIEGRTMTHEGAVIYALEG